ncbi:MAG: T9SS type A sorting domain-containing protein, partial [Bacteroidetes bacterium]|nr:T9SS type A sorting domain-containing protein [Bacteroidota bacterium]
QLPVDGSTYTWDAFYGNGDDLGGGNYIAYIGAADSILITGLLACTEYYIAVVGFNGCLNPNYLVSSVLSGSQITAEPLIITALGDHAYCPDESIPLQFTTQMNFSLGNIFSLELSDTNGSFTSPALVDTVQSNMSGTFNGGTVPWTLPGGTSYKLRITSTAPVTNCVVYGADIEIFDAPPKPVITTAGSIVFCEGDSVVLISSISDSILWNDNQTTNDSLSVGVSEAYTVTHTDTNGCMIVSDSVITTQNPLPQVSLGALNPLCENSPPYTFSQATPPGGTYTGTGISGNTIDPSVIGSGTHMVTYTYTDTNGCTNIDSSQMVIHPFPVVSYMQGDSVCEDDSIIELNPGSPRGGTYSGTAITDSLFDPTLAGLGVHSITYTYQDTNQCTSQDSSEITVNAIPDVTFDVEDTLFCLETDPILVLNQGTPPGGVYSGPGVSGFTFDLHLAGQGIHVITYHYTDGNGCSNTAEQIFIVDICEGILRGYSSQPYIYPNPTDGILYINDDNKQLLRTEIMSLTGQLIVTDETGNTVYDLSALPKGTYFVRLVTKQESRLTRLIIQ